jgi:hypothetical protein
VRCVIQKKSNRVASEDKISSVPNGGAQQAQAKYKEHAQPWCGSEMQEAEKVIGGLGSAAERDGKGYPLGDEGDCFHPRDLEQPENEGGNHGKSDERDDEQRPRKSEQRNMHCRKESDCCETATEGLRPEFQLRPA